MIKKLSCSLFLFLFLAIFAGRLSAEIRVTNHQENSIVRYPVVLLRGTTGDVKTKIHVSNLNATDETSPAVLTLFQDKFKALVELVPGKNEIEIKEINGRSLRKISIEYKKQTNPFYVRLVWMTDKDGDTDFAAPSDECPQDYEARLRTVAQLMQTSTAERMHDLGYGRKTFRLERDARGKIIVHTFTQPKTAEYYYKIKNDQVWYREVREWLNNEHPNRFAKNIVLAAYTRKDPKTGKMKAHTALGGGNLGLFGSGSVFSWPSDLSAAVDAFEDARMVDPKRVHEDSAGRGTYWAVASTTIGATLHEMGHTFGLPHCKDRFGIMTRGFDHFNRVFTFHDPPMKRAGIKHFTQKEEAYFAPVSASFLQWSHWFQLDEKTAKDLSRPVINFDKANNKIIVTSKSGVPWVGFWVGDNIHTFREFKESPKTIELTLDEINSQLKGKKVSKISVISSNGISSRFAIQVGS